MSFSSAVVALLLAVCEVHSSKPGGIRIRSRSGASNRLGSNIEAFPASLRSRLSFPQRLLKLSSGKILIVWRNLEASELSRNSAARGFVADVGTKFPLFVDVCYLLGNKRACECMLGDDFSVLLYHIQYSCKLPLLLPLCLCLCLGPPFPLLKVAHLTQLDNFFRNFGFRVIDFVSDEDTSRDELIRTRI